MHSAGPRRARIAAALVSDAVLGRAEAAAAGGPAGVSECPGPGRAPARGGSAAAFANNEPQRSQHQVYQLGRAAPTSRRGRPPARTRAAWACADPAAASGPSATAAGGCSTPWPSKRVAAARETVPVRCDASAG